MFRRWLSFALLVALAALGRAGGPAAFPLPRPVAEIVGSNELFSRFVAPVKAALAESHLEAKVLLGLRAHLALHERDAAEARRVVAALRALPGSPEEKAFAGLVTEAQVAAWTPGTTFAGELAARLATLPRTAAMAVLLQRQRDRLATMTSESLRAEAAELGRKLDAARRCDWHDADQLIRLHHRQVNVLPLRDPLVAALDAAIAERSRP